LHSSPWADKVSPSIRDVPRGTYQIIISTGKESAMAVTQKNKPRLGRGLSSLISVGNLPVEVTAEQPGNDADAKLSEGKPGKSTPHSGQNPPPVAAAAPAPDGSPLLVSIEIIRPNPYQPRKTIRESAIAELAASLKSSGIIQPLIVRRVEGGFELIAGERRWLAAKLAGLVNVPVVVRDVDSFTQAQMALVENIQREDLNPIERAMGYRTLMEQLGLTQAELAGRMGEDRSSVANYLRLLDLAEPVRNMVRDGQLSMGHAKLLAGIPDILEQQKLADIAISQSLSVRNLERLLLNRANGAEAPVAKKPVGSSAHLQDLEKSLARQLGLRVQLRSSSKGKGRLILHYAILDQFDELLQKLGAKVE
jgi:ParB family chromosome partitioning protein